MAGPPRILEQGLTDPAGVGVRGTGRGRQESRDSKRLCQRLHKSHQTPSLARTSWATMAAFGSQIRPILNKDKVDLCIRF